MPLQQSQELAVGLQSFTIDFVAANRQFDWIEISLVYDKSDKHALNYDSYHLEQEIVFIQNVSIENISNTYRDSNELKYDINDVTEKHRLYK